jgi:hypothetical protein
VKTRGLRIKDGGWQARSVLECSGKAKQRRSFSTAPVASESGVALRLPPQSKTWRHFVVLTLLALSTLILQPSTVSAQQYSIDWYKIAGGGGTSTGATYQVSGTIGQHDASGPMIGGNYSLTGGFWALISAVQTAGAPTLFISHAGNTVTVYWESVPDWGLQQNPTLDSTGWLPTSYYVMNVNGTNQITITPPTGNLFFRLAK